MSTVLIGVPCSRVIRAEFPKMLLDSKTGWLADTGKHVVTQMWENTAGRIDWSRSNIIERAKQTNVDLCIQVDTDVGLETPFRDTLSYISQDLHRGYDIIIGPTVGVNMRIMLELLPEMLEKKLLPSGKNPFEVKAGAFGFVAFSKPLLHALKPYGFITDIGDKRYPLYLQYQSETTEDFTLCHAARDLGFKVCVDPRIRVSHYKEAPMFPGWFDDDPRSKYPNGIRVGPAFGTSQDAEMHQEESAPAPEVAN